MSIKSDDQVAKLTRHVKLLEQALLDERDAKKALEQKLDDIDQHKFESYKELISALKQANNRQVQLKVLSTLAHHQAVSTSTIEMLTTFLVETSQLLEGAAVFLFDYKNPERAVCYHLNATASKLERLFHGRLDITNLLGDIEEDDSHWRRLQSSGNEWGKITEHFANNYLISFSYQRLKKRKNLVIIDLPHYCYSEDVKQTLDTAAQQFVSALQKRSTEEKLARNFHQLERTVKKLKNTQKQLVHSEKMASIGQLAAGIAHEVNNPIGYVKSNLSVLGEYVEIFNKALDEAAEHIPADDELSFAQEDIGELMASCHEGIERVADIVSGLNSFSRKDDEAKFSAVNLNHVAEESIKIAWNQVKYNSEVVTDFDEDIPAIDGHKGELQQVLINLIVNASHAIEENGLITIKTWSDDKVHISVNDNGSGMDENTKNKLFEPFFTTKPEGKGTGLGLSISYAIIEKHSGDIAIESTVGEGTQFILSFPRK